MYVLNTFFNAFLKPQPRIKFPRAVGFPGYIVYAIYLRSIAQDDLRSATTTCHLKQQQQPHR